VALVLLVLETVVLYWMLPETKGWVVVDDEGGKEKTDGDEKKEKKVVASLEERKRMLAKLMRLVRFPSLLALPLNLAADETTASLCISIGTSSSSFREPSSP
jgi:hypothetical protein